MDEFAVIVILVWLFAGTCSLGLFGLSDFREFDSIKKQCQESHFIQNKTTRITCEVEKLP